MMGLSLNTGEPRANIIKTYSCAHASHNTQQTLVNAPPHDYPERETAAEAKNSQRLGPSTTRALGSPIEPGSWLTVGDWICCYLLCGAITTDGFKRHRDTQG